MAFQDPYDNRIGSGALPQGIWGANNRAYTRQAQGNEMVQNQLNQITGSNSAYIQQARQAAAAGANARGLGNSSYAMGNAQGAAIRAALPIAQSDAEANRNAATENLQWLNQRAMSDANNSANLMAANRSAGAQREIAAANNAAQLQRQRENLAYEGEQAGLGRTFQQYMGAMSPYLQDYYNTQQWGRDIYGNTIGSVLGTTLSNPDYFQDPQAAFGMMQGFSGYVGGMLGDYFNNYFGNAGGRP